MHSPSHLRVAQVSSRLDPPTIAEENASAQGARRRALRAFDTGRGTMSSCHSLAAGMIPTPLRALTCVPGRLDSDGHRQRQEVHGGVGPPPAHQARQGQGCEQSGGKPPLARFGTHASRVQSDVVQGQVCRGPKDLRLLRTGARWRLGFSGGYNRHLMQVRAMAANESRASKDAVSRVQPREQP